MFGVLRFGFCYHKLHAMPPLWPNCCTLGCSLCINWKVECWSNAQYTPFWIPGCFWYSARCMIMMASSNGNIFRVTGPLCGQFAGHRQIPLTKASDAELCCFLWSAPWINGWVNDGEADDLRRHRVHYDVIVINTIWEPASQVLRRVGKWDSHSNTGVRFIINESMGNHF